MGVSYFLPKNQLSLKLELERIESDSEAKALLFLMAENNQYSESELISAFNKLSKPLIGGVFPEVLFKGERKKEGIVLIQLNFSLKTQLIDLEVYNTANPIQFDFSLIEGNRNQNSLFIFADALSKNKNGFIQSVFNFFGINTTYLGGGAGSLSFYKTPCIITNTGIYQDAAVIGWTDKKIALGAAHGWGPITNPMKVTHASGNLLKQINWKPAFEVYKEIVENHSGREFNESNFFQIAKSYPLGVSKIDGEQIVRDPIMRKEGSLLIIDAIEEGEYISVLHGDIDSLLAGAKKAKEFALSKQDNSMNLSRIFCIDCISRALFMQSDFNKELEIIAENTEVNGILSIGEIANSKDSFLEIYNKTIVVGIW